MLTTATSLKAMSRSCVRASQRTRALAQHMSTSTSPPKSEPNVLFESNLAVRTYVLNRPKKLNALDEPMLGLLRPKIEEWNASDLCNTIVGTSVGKAFCVGGDVASVVTAALDPATRSHAIDFFKREFELDYILATLRKPYVTVLDGITMGGGIGLAAGAPFRIATENTIIAMPETKIGYFPDVGASYFLSRMDGELGTYLGLTSETLEGRAVFELGFATHYVPSRRIPILLDRLAALEKAHVNMIDRSIEEFSSERLPEEPPTLLIGETRSALDYAFRHNSVEKILEDLETLVNHQNPSVSQWAEKTLTTLHLRSPTSLKVALKAIRLGRHMTLWEALEMEFKVAGAFCNGASPDFFTGVKAVLVQKIKERPQWSPASLQDVSDEVVSRFFAPTSHYLSSLPTLSMPEQLTSVSSRPTKYTLPTEDEIGAMVRGSHSSGGGTGVSLDELVAKFNDLRPGKLGVKEKVVEVAQRKCEVVDNGGDGNTVWLKWKHSLDRP